MELYAAHGFEQTTPADIAATAGLTERTFFRHFADKREVIFNGSGEFEAGFVQGVEAAPPGGSALGTVAFALEAASPFFPDERRDYSRLRQTIIEANPSLHERERLKMTALSTAIAAALRERGVPEPHATLAAESGVTVFGVAFRQWLEPGETQSLAAIERAVLAELRLVTGSPAAPVA